MFRALKGFPCQRAKFMQHSTCYGVFAPILPQSCCTPDAMSPTRLISLTQTPTKVERKRARRNLVVETALRRCHRCRGTGQAVCQICSGAGEVMRGRDIFGRFQYARCCGCFGTKSTRCPTCGGLGWT